MPENQNWNIETDAKSYFRNQKKQLQIADRRPVIRKASDLVGPGIGVSAVRITDFNNSLAMFDGYYSSVPGAPHAPNSTDSFIGSTAMDDELGGRQVFASLDTGIVYSRLFLRNPSDASFISWGSWEVEFDPDPAPRAWSAYTPVWGSVGTAPTLGNGSISGKYFQNGLDVHVKASIAIGSSTTLGSGAYTISLPVNANEAAFTIAGSALVYDVSAALQYAAAAYFNNGSQVILIQNATRVTSSTPVALASGDVISMLLTYEAS